MYDSEHPKHNDIKFKYELNKQISENVYRSNKYNEIKPINAEFFSYTIFCVLIV